MTFSDLVIGLRLETARFTNAMNNVRRQTQAFSTQLANATVHGSADRLISGYTELSRQLHSVGLGFKDIARIAAGITISQTFYTITRSIKEATSALWEFNESLDYAQVTYGSLFGNSDLASDFIDTLKDFSVDTIFEYTDIEGMARKLSAYGIEYKNLMYIIEGLTNLGTISGDSAALERLAVAIGQINAKGTLKAEEMRQLANAYVPIYDILREKLHLTEEDLKRVGDLGIKSADAINAIIEYANETFGATADAAVFTITGLNNRIVDTLKVMGAAIMTPVSTFYKSLAKYIADSLNEIHQIYNQSGLAGVFEHLVPSEEWQNRLRSLIAAIKNFVYTLALNIITALPYIKQFLGGVIDAFTLFLGVLNTAGTAFAGLMQTLSNHTTLLRTLTAVLVGAAGGWILFRIHALGAMVISVLKVVILDVAKAVVVLTTVLTKHPLVAGLVILGAVLLAVAANANNTNSAISNLINSFNSFSAGGTVADDVLQAGGAMDEATDNSDKFWESMEGGATDAEEAIDGVSNAAKKASRNLLSFDEVFRLNEDGSVGGSGALDGLGDITDALSGLGSALIPEIPDLSGFANDFVNSLYTNLWDSIKTIATGGATGALIGGLVGFTIGGFVTKTMAGALTGASWGAKIGTIAGAAFAGFWTDAYKSVEDELINIAVGASVGTLAGGLVGMVIGAFATKTLDGALTGASYGAAIGGLLGGSLGAFWETAGGEMETVIAEAVKIAEGVTEGAIAGALTGLVVGAYAMGDLKGAIAGAKYGAKLGAILGGGFAAFFGDAEDGMKSSLESLMSSVSAVSTGTLIGGIAGMIVGAVVGAFAGGVGALPGAATGAKIGAAIGALGTVIYEWLTESGANEAIGQWLADMLFDVSWWFDDLEETLTSACDEIKSNITDWYDSVSIDSSDFFRNIGSTISSWFSEITTSVSSWLSERYYSITDWYDELYIGTHDFYNDISSGLSTWFSKLTTSITTWFSDRYYSITDWYDNLYIGIHDWFNKTEQSVREWWSRLWNVSAWQSGWQNVRSWFESLLSNIRSWFEGRVQDVRSSWSTLWKSSSWSSAWSHISGWFSQLFADIKEWFEGLGDSIDDWWDDLWSGKTISASIGNAAGTFFGNIGNAVGLGGHATGGIFNREHIARFAEGNKAEAVIPLENRTAMEPFVNAISDGILQGILPTLSAGGSSNNLPPMYVGTLIGDEKGLQQLFKKFEVYEAKELARKGTA